MTEIKKGDVVCFCGSTKFKDQFLKYREQCESLGAIALIPEVFKHADELELTTYQIEVLNELHKLKIGLSDYVIILNVNGYIGEQTYDEIDFAAAVDVPVYFLEENNE